MSDEDINVSNPDPPKRIRTEEPLGPSFVGTGEWVVIPIDWLHKIEVYGPFLSREVAHAWAVDWGFEDAFIRKLKAPLRTIPGEPT